MCENSVGINRPIKHIQRMPLNVVMATKDLLNEEIKNDFKQLTAVIFYLR